MLRLAEEDFFGRDMLMLCTPKCARGRPALPIKELSDLKLILFGNIHPAGAMQRSLRRCGTTH